MLSRQRSSTRSDALRAAENSSEVIDVSECRAGHDVVADGAMVAVLYKKPVGDMEIKVMAGKMDPKTQIELEAAAFRRLVSHLRGRVDVQNIQLMELAGFCRNCLSNWFREAAEDKGLPVSKDQSRELIYGMPYAQWKEKYQTEATADQLAAFEKQRSSHEDR